KWRVDFSSYKKALITNTKGEVVGEVKYPKNTFNIKHLSKRYDVLFVTAIDLRNEKSDPVKIDLTKDYSSLYTAKPMDRIIVKKQIGENARFVNAQSDKEFVAKGVNYCRIRTGDHDSFEPVLVADKALIDIADKSPFTLQRINLNDTLICYDPYHIETMMRALNENGYNLVRVFVKTGERDSEETKVYGLSGWPETKGISKAYMDNFVDFLTRANKYSIYVIPCFTENEMLDNDYFNELSKGASGQDILFSEAGIKAKQHYIELFLKYIKANNPELINTLFALTMQNEFAFHSYEAPFDQTSGTYTFLDGSKYDMSNDDERRTLANRAIRHYYKKMKEAVEENAPGLLVGEGTFSMGAVGKTYQNSKGFRPIDGVEDLRFPMTAVELLSTDIDFLDFHVYRWGKEGLGKDVFDYFVKNMHLDSKEGKKLMQSKPVIMGEFGSFKENETQLDDAIDFVKELKQAALDFGFKGTCYWTIDTFEQKRLWNLMWDNGKMLKAFYEQKKNNGR
ncbi:MAG: hypothetical protein ABFS12_15445, partial [Bacteroidota bacterium]